MLLINPPVIKPCEPAAGIGRLAGALEARAIPCEVLDASLEGLLFLLETAPVPEDTWTLRAHNNRERDLTLLRSPEGYRNRSRYNTAVNNLNRLLEARGRAEGVSLSLANYQDNRLKPQSSGDLLKAAQEPERNLFYPYFQNRLLPLLQEQNFSAIGISLTYLSQALCGFALAGFIKQHAPETRIIAGGGLITTWLSHPDWKNPFGELFDHLVEGPGEEKLITILEGKAPEAGKYFALPSYKKLPLEKYLSPGPVIPYNTSLGCYWNRCTFCPEEAENNRFYPLAPKSAVKELHQLKEQYAPILFHLCDNALSPAFLKALTADPPGVPWYGFARIDKNLESPAFCMELKKAGCVMLKLGLESGDQKVLEGINKGIDLSQAERVLTNLGQAGIGTFVYLLFGTPEEDYEAAKNTLEFTARHHKAITYLNLAVFNMPLYGRMAGRHDTGSFYEGDLTLYTDFRHPAGWDRRQVRQFLDKEFKTHPAIRDIINRKPPCFTSNHGALFLI